MFQTTIEYDPVTGRRVNVFLRQSKARRTLVYRGAKFVGYVVPSRIDWQGYRVNGNGQPCAWGGSRDGAALSLARLDAA